MAASMTAIGIARTGTQQAEAETVVAPERLIVSGFRGTKMSDPDVDRILRYLEAGEIAGVILLRRNISSPDQVLKLALAFRAAAAPNLPIISIDQEGGLVSRLDGTIGFSDWMSAAEMGYSGMTDDDALMYYLIRAREMMSVGINLNFGPILDLNVNPANPIIGALDRSFGKNPDIVFRRASAFVQAHREAGVMTCAKHFPGHGSSASDSHHERTDINSSWTESEMLPFREMAMADELDALMASHVVHRRFSDAGTWPASLSRLGSEVARLELGFTGPIFTDDLQMRAITDQYEQGQAAVAGVGAGNTFLIYANHRDADTIETAAEVSHALYAASIAGRLDPLTLAARRKVALAFFGKLN